MGTGSIEVGDIRLEYPEEVLLMQDEQVIEALPAYASKTSAHDTH